MNNGKNFVLGCVCKSTFSRDLNHIKKLSKSFPSVEKTWFEIFEFLSNFDLISMGIKYCNSFFKLNLSR